MRKPTLHPDGQEALYAYIAGLLKNKKCRPFAINGTEDHLHIVSSLHPSLHVSGLIKDIKLSTCDYLSRSGILPDFEGWQAGYGSFTYAKSALQNLTRYVNGQKEHHRISTFRDEFMDLLREHGIDFDERYLF